MKKPTNDKLGLAALVIVIATVAGVGAYMYKKQQNDDQE